MPKVRKIREIEPRVKSVRELKKSEEEIEEITASEIPVEESPMTSSEPVSLGGSAEVRDSVPRDVNVLPETGSVQEEERIEESRLYEARGTALVETHVRADSEKRYATAEAIQTERMKEARIGSGVSQQRSLLPEGQAVQATTRLREESDTEKKYSERIAGEGGRKERKMPGEI